MTAASGMAIDSWGPKAWGFLHAASFKYPDTPTVPERIAWSNLLHSLAVVLPCAVCRKHFGVELGRTLARREHARVLDSRDALTRWLVDVHNDVNERNKKRPWTYDEVLQVYQPSEHVCSAPGSVGPDSAQQSDGDGGDESLPVASLRGLLLSAGIAVVALLLLALARAGTCEPEPVGNVPVSSGGSPPR